MSCDVNPKGRLTAAADEWVIIVDITGARWIESK